MNEYDYEGYTIEHKYEVGQKVMWSGAWGTQPSKPAVITGTGEKNGKPLYDLDNGHWAYEYQLRVDK